MIITGNGNAGSWRIRGEQLGEALGETVIPRAQNLVGQDVYLVKKDGWCNLNGARSIIWDIVDCWPQPEGNSWHRQKLIDHILQTAARIKANHIIAATRKMAEDLGTPYFLYHHGRTYEKFNVIRENVKKVGYEGNPDYLGSLEPFIREQCNQRGWEFVINPESLLDVDILVAMRADRFRGYATDNWKSNVKLVNAQNSGTPIIVCRESGYEETQSGAELWADTPGELVKAFNILDHQGERLWRAATLRNKMYTVLDAARDFRKFNLC